MKVLPSLLIFTLTSAAMAGNARIKVIYGEDNRVDPVDSSNEMFKKLSKSTAAMIAHRDMSELNAEQMLIAGKTLEQTGVCSTERFAQQPAAANCSGFLVGENKLVTAGHCIKNALDCSESAWVFDYKVDHVQQSEVVVDKSDVYKCKSIIKQELDSTTKNDMALIELERVVEDREVLKYRSEGTPSVGDPLVVIGHPSGLPTKIADGASIRSVGEVFFVANLDTYGGNSGSAVFNANTGVIEGILVRGETDYIWSGNCRASNVLGDSAGDGEEVTLIKMVGLEPQVEEPEVPSEPSEPSEPEQPEQPEQPELPEPPVQEEETWWDRFLRWLRGA